MMNQRCYLEPITSHYEAGKKVLNEDIVPKWVFNKAEECPECQRIFRKKTWQKAEIKPHTPEIICSDWVDDD